MSYDGNMAKSYGEKAYANSFQFKAGVDAADHEELRDFLYKYSFNLSEAYEYLRILTQVNEIDSKVKSELFYRIYAMSLQSFALCIRKLTDQPSERSIRKLIDFAVKPLYAQDHKDQIDEIYKHYKKFLNKFVVHQDVDSIHVGIGYFPDLNVITKDMAHLREYYLQLTNEICTKHINVSGKSHDYSSELLKIVIVIVIV